MKNSLTLRIVALCAAAAVTLSGCAATGAGDSSTPAQGASATMKDPWLKAVDDGMTAGFGTIVNNGDHEVTVTAVTSPASDDLELHETVANESGAMVMREKTGGFTIPAHGELHLEPGGSHIMLMDLPKALAPGSEVSMTLQFSDQSTLEFSAPVKDFAGANENYHGSEHGDLDDAPAESTHDH